MESLPPEYSLFATGNEPKPKGKEHLSEVCSRTRRVLEEKKRQAAEMIYLRRYE